VEKKFRLKIQIRLGVTAEQQICHSNKSGPVEGLGTVKPNSQTLWNWGWGLS